MSNELQQYVAVGWTEELGGNYATWIPVEAIGDAVTVTDGNNDPWTIHVCWTREAGRLIPTTAVITSDNGKPLTSSVMRTLPISSAIDAARSKRLQDEAESAAVVARIRLAEAGSDAPQHGLVKYDDAYYRRLGELWFADTGGTWGRVRRVGQNLWTEQGNPGEAPEAFQSQVRKRIVTARERGYLDEAILGGGLGVHLAKAWPDAPDLRGMDRATPEYREAVREVADRCSDLELSPVKVVAYLAGVSEETARRHIKQATK